MAKPTRHFPFATPGSSRPFLSLALALLLGLTVTPVAAQEEAPQIGPATGSVVAIGGGGISPELYQRFIELAGGRHALIVYIPSAAGRPSYGPDFAGWALSGFEEQGATRTLMLHAADREQADSEAFVAPLREAGGVFFGGGRQWRLVDLYAGTKTEEALRGVLERGGVVGGSSAGATILGSYLARGDTRGNQIMMGDHEEGFGFLRDVAIDQHLLRRNRQFDLLEIVKARPELLGIGIDEGAAIIVHGNRFEVMDGYVAIYDAKRFGGRDRFYLLASGDQFDLSTREALRSSEGPDQLWLPQLAEVVEVEVAALKRLAGAYASESTTVKILLEDGRLHLESDRRPRRPLRAISPLSFLDAANGQLLTFDPEAGTLELGPVGQGEILRRTE